MAPARSRCGGQVLPTRTVDMSFVGESPGKDVGYSSTVSTDGPLLGRATNRPLGDSTVGWQGTEGQGSSRPEDGSLALKLLPGQMGGPSDDPFRQITHWRQATR